jgi:nucleotide-binding universal stress UspA family protein
MKNILILTDFSENATHAAECGVIPSSKLHAEILLLNTFVHAIGIPNYSGVAVTTGGIIEMEDESKENLKILAERLDHQIAQLPVGEYRPSIKYQLGE